MTAGSALAGIGSEPGNLVLSPATGAQTLTPTWSTLDGCPAGFQGSAEVLESTGTGTIVSPISNVVNSGLTAPFSGQLNGSVGTLLGPHGISTTSPGTAEWVVDCYSGPSATGNSELVQSVFVSLSASGTYTTSAVAPTPQQTVTTLTASPSPAASGATVTLTASVTAADGSSPAGTVQFASGSTNLDAFVVVNAGGVATPATMSVTAMTTTSSATEALSAVFTPTDSLTYGPSTGTFSLPVQPAPIAGAIPVDVAVPQTGQLTVTVSTTAIALVSSVATTPATATGTLNDVSVSDTRSNAPGWVVMGQDTAFTSPVNTFTIPGDDMGWTPNCITLSGGATCGQPVPPGSSTGLADAAQVLASAPSGSGLGSDTLSASLTLDIPATAPVDPYQSTVTITYLVIGP